MFCRFDISEPPLIQSAGHCYYPTPSIHPARNCDKLNFPYHDFIYMVDGEWEIILNNDAFTMKKDDVLILPANLPHYGIKQGSPNLRTMYFHIYNRANDKAYTNEPIDEYSIILNNFVNAATNPCIKHLFERIIQTKESATASSAYVTALLHELSNLSKAESKSGLAQEIRDFIVTSGKLCTNDQIAAHFYISKRKAEILFKENYGVTMHEYIIRYMLEEAKRYILDYPNMKISTIAQILGFYDSCHFSRTFKQYFGVSPKDFKAQTANIPKK